MEPISSHARQAKANKENRTHTKRDLAVKAGVALNTPYLISEDGERKVVVVDDVRHENNDYHIDSLGQWQRPRDVPRDRYNAGVELHCTVYDTVTVTDTLIKTDRSTDTERVFTTPAVPQLDFTEIEQAANDPSTYIHIE